jgi:hypothetical protein
VTTSWPCWRPRLGWRGLVVSNRVGPWISSHWLRFIVGGKNAASAGYFFGLDEIYLLPAK